MLTNLGTLEKEMQRMRLLLKIEGIVVEPSVLESVAESKSVLVEHLINFAGPTRESSHVAVHEGLCSISPANDFRLKASLLQLPLLALTVNQNGLQVESLLLHFDDLLADLLTLLSVPSVDVVELVLVIAHKDFVSVFLGESCEDLLKCLIFFSIS
jgi:hypothetical protein